MLKEQTFK